VRRFIRFLRGNTASQIILGIVTLSIVVLTARLPDRIIRGDLAKTAIHMLDSMRRPLIAIQHVESGLLRPGYIKPNRRQGPGLRMGFALYAPRIYMAYLYSV